MKDLARRHGWIKVGVTILLGLVASTGHALPDDRLVDKAAKKIDAGEFDSALADLTEAARLWPSDPRPRYMSGVAHQKKGDAKAAEADFRAALKLDPKLAEVRSELGALLLEEGRSADAIAELSRATQADPKLADAWFNLGQAHFSAGDCKSSSVAYEHSVSIRPDVDGYINLSLAQRKCKDLKAAMVAAERATKLDAKSGAAFTALGLVRNQAGDFEAAATALKRATELDATDATAWWSWGVVELHLRRLDAALLALTRAQTLKPNAAITTDLGLAYRDRGEFAKAEAVFRQALAKDGNYAAARWHLAQVLAAQQKCEPLEVELRSLPTNDAAGKLRAKCGK